MPEEQTHQGSSCFLQGCLFGAVGLFAVLLLVMLFLAFARFRENTGGSDDVGDVGVVASPGFPPLASRPVPPFAADHDKPIPSDPL